MPKVKFDNKDYDFVNPDLALLVATLNLVLINFKAFAPFSGSLSNSLRKLNLAIKDSDIKQIKEAVTESQFFFHPDTFKRQEGSVAVFQTLISMPGELLGECKNIDDLCTRLSNILGTLHKSDYSSPDYVNFFAVADEYVEKFQQMAFLDVRQAMAKQVDYDRGAINTGRKGPGLI